MKSAVCPSCGAPVVFRSAASVFAVCAYCKSTLVREDDALKRIGRMAELLEDNSPLQLGSEGSYRGRKFTLVGRIQLKYEAGVWNEWYALFDDGSDGWLSDASGEMTMTFKVEPEEKEKTLPSFADLQVGQEIRLGRGSGESYGAMPEKGRKKEAEDPFIVTSLERVLVVSASGELPHGVTAGYEAPVVDLRVQEEGNDASASKDDVRESKSRAVDASRKIVSFGVPFASIDYSDAPPSVFIGESLPFSALNLSHLKEGVPLPGADARLKVRAFQCPGCGVPLSAREAIVAVVCAGCGTVVDSENEILKTLQEAQGALTVKPDIPLGSKGCFENDEYEVIGFLVQETKADGMTYWWREYLLHCPRAGFRWLTEYDGHWNFVTPLSRVPKSTTMDENSKKIFDTVEYTFFQSARAKIIQVAGEFYWRVRQGDKTAVDDYIAPPYVLSSEKNRKEITWSRGSYIEGEEIWRVFGLKNHPPAKKGIGVNQLSPFATQTPKVYVLCLALAILSFVIQLGLSAIYGGGPLIFDHEMTFIPKTESEAKRVTGNAGFSVNRPTVRTSSEVPEQPENQAYAVSPGEVNKINFMTLRTPVFHFNGGRLFVHGVVSIDDNEWFGFDLTLVNQKTGQEIRSYREAYRASGRDSDGSWSEAKTNDFLIFRGIDAGDYYFLVDAESGGHTENQSGLNLQVRRADLGWGNWWLFNAFLGALSLFAAWRREAFEVARWSESDHPRRSWVSAVKTLLNDDE